MKRAVASPPNSTDLFFTQIAKTLHQKTTKQIVKNTRRVSLAAVAGLVFGQAPQARAADLYWYPGGVNGGTGVWTGGSDWNTAADGTGSASAWTSASTAVFGGTAGTVSISGDTSTAGVVVKSGGYLLQSNNGNKTLALNGGFTVDAASGSVTTLAASLRLGLNDGIRTFDVADGNSLVLLGRITSAASGPAAFGGPGGIIKTGSGTLSLNDVSNFNGGITLNEGTLRVSISNAFLNTANTYATLDNKLTLNGGTLENSGSSAIVARVSTDFNGAITFAGTNTITFDGSAGVAGSAALRLISSSTLSVHAGSTVRITDVLGEDTAGRSLTKAGDGLLVLNQNNTYTGGTTISGGTLQLGNGSTAGSVVGDIVNNSVLSFARSDASSFDAVISGTGSVVKAGSGTLTLSSANTYSGSTSVAAGTLIIGGGASLASSGIAVASGASLVYSSTTAYAGNVEVSGTLGGRGRIDGVVSGSGTVGPGESPGILTVSGVNTAAGLGFAFEFTGTGSPLYGNAGASGNDVLRLTSATPFSEALDADNLVSVYLNVGSLDAGDVFRGGFYVDNGGDFLASVGGATFQYYLFNGAGYDLYTGPLSFEVGLVAEAADFGAGAVNGSVTQFTVVPEPAGLAFAGAAVLLVLHRRKSKSS